VDEGVNTLAKLDRLDLLNNEFLWLKSQRLQKVDVPFIKA
jgi:hypothetical protein